MNFLKLRSTSKQEYANFSELKKSILNVLKPKLTNFGWERTYDSDIYEYYPTAADCFAAASQELQNTYVDTLKNKLYQLRWYEKDVNDSIKEILVEGLMFWCVSKLLDLDGDYRLCWENWIVNSKDTVYLSLDKNTSVKEIEEALSNDEVFRYFDSFS